MAAPAGSADYVCREWGIRDVAALIGGASVYVGNDSGLSHVAVWAAGSQRPRTPCVLVFPRLNIRNWGTNRPWVRLVEYRYCQRDLPTVETVMNAVASLVACP
jgi:ADP-heptose:LPS heptosyltransferase